MASRIFEGRTVTIDGKPSSASIITCAQCGTEGTFVHAGTRKPSEAIEQYFRHRDWHVGKQARADRCPSCVRAPRERKPSAMNDDLKAADTPRQMSRDDRRIVFAKLDEVYLDAEQGYAAPWTDAAVAKDLGVPPAWVSGVREELFGPAGSNAQLDAFLAESKELRQAVERLVLGAKAEAEKLQHAIAALERRIRKEIGL